MNSFLGNLRSIEYFFGDGTGGTSEWQKSITRKKAMTKIFGIFEIHRKFPEMGRFKCGISLENPKSADLLDFPLHFLYKCKGKSIK